MCMRGRGLEDLLQQNLDCNSERLRELTQQWDKKKKQSVAAMRKLHQKFIRSDSFEVVLEDSAEPTATSTLSIAEKFASSIAHFAIDRRNSSPTNTIDEGEVDNAVNHVWLTDQTSRYD